MNSDTVQTDKQVLSRWFDLSRFPPPDSVQWAQRAIGPSSDRLPGPTDYYVIAVLKYTGPLPDLAAQLHLSPGGDVYVEDSLLESWLPNVIVDRFIRTPEGHLKFDGTAYTTGSLLVSPLSYGYLLIIENYILVYGVTG
jgi:hypothetical protein